MGGYGREREIHLYVRGVPEIHLTDALFHEDSELQRTYLALITKPIN